MKWLSSKEHDGGYVSWLEDLGMVVGITVSNAGYILNCYELKLNSVVLVASSMEEAQKAAVAQVRFRLASFIDHHTNMLVKLSAGKSEGET